MRGSTLVTVFLLIAVSVVLSRRFSYNARDRRLSRIKPVCPDRPHKLRVKYGRRNRGLGSCTVTRWMRAGNKDTCRHKSLSCCPNIYGEDVCVRVAGLRRRERARSSRKPRITFKQRRPARITKPISIPTEPPQQPERQSRPAPPPVEHAQHAQPLDDGLEVPLKKNFLCPKPKFVEFCNDKGECHIAEECTDFAISNECTASDSLCSKGYICCNDPCHKPTRGQKQLRWCYPESDASGVEMVAPPKSIPFAVDDALMITPPTEDKCPSAAENCDRLNCEGFRLENSCPAYDEAYTVCDETSPCGPTRMCCPDTCPGSESRLCMIPAGKIEEIYIPPEPPVMVDDGPDLTGLQCPQTSAGCVAYLPPPGVAGAGQCTNSTDCSEDRMCCQLSTDCQEQFCIKPVDMDQVERGCPRPFISLPSNVDSEITCTSNTDCQPEETCCAIISDIEEKYCYKKD